MQMTDLRAEIATRLDRGDRLGRVDEEVIRPSVVTDDAKAALSLYGWCLQDEGERHEPERWERSARVELAKAALRQLRARPRWLAGTGWASAQRKAGRADQRST
jgi:hypothetical protein